MDLRLREIQAIVYDNYTLATALRCRNRITNNECSVLQLASFSPSGSFDDRSLLVNTLE